MRRAGRSIAFVASALLVVCTVGLGIGPSAAEARSSTTATQSCPRPPAVAPAALAGITPYREAVAAAGAHGMQVWLEADLL